MNVISRPQATPDSVLAKAFLNVGKQLNLTQTQLGDAIGLHRSNVSKLSISHSLDPKSKQGELALLVIRLARALYALAGGDKDFMQTFIHSHNKMTGGVPAQQIGTIQGLMTVLRFVDAVRGKV